jgi:hypothetical protein
MVLKQANEVKDKDLANQCAAMLESLRIREAPAQMLTRLPFPGKHVSDIDLSFLSCKKRFRLLMLKYLAGELRDEQYNWLTAAEKYQLFLRGDVNFITMREAQMIASLMRKVEHRARLWMADNLSDEELAECEL